ncbi:MAG: DinB family protein [Anaerolineaceae bacterium]
MENDKLIKVGIENNFEGRSLAYALDHPGCFAYGLTETEALIRMPQSLLAYKSWLEGYTENSWLQDLSDFDVRLVEVFECHFLNDSFEPSAAGKGVYGWFHHDWLPLTAVEIQRGLSVLEWAHQDLYELTAALSDQKLDKAYSGERWSIRGILSHVASAELFYLNRLGLTRYKRSDLPEGAWESLKMTLQLNMEILPQMVDKADVRGVEGEFWSPRKIIRRACWHALDHCQHIHRLITTLE